MLNCDTFRPLMRFGVALLLGSLALVANGCGGNAGASPAQPIDFPHKLHADNQISCAFCHEFYDRYASAGIPETELCATCHLAMPQDSDATQKLIEYIDSEERIPWVRLYQLPQFTYFPHKWHVRAGVACETCHGDIGQSMRAVRHQELEMEWCIDCHEREQVSVDCVVCHK